MRSSELRLIRVSTSRSRTGGASRPPSGWLRSAWRSSARPPSPSIWTRVRSSVACCTCSTRTTTFCSSTCTTSSATSGPPASSDATWTLCYNARRAGRPPSARAADAVSSRTTLDWQRAWIDERTRSTRSSQYWRQQLAELPDARPPRRIVHAPRFGAAAGRRYARARSQSTSATTSDGCARDIGCRRSWCCLAALDVLLHRYAGGGRHRHRRADRQPELAGERVPGRRVRQHRRDADRPHGDPTFAELLGRVRQVALDAYANQDVPFADGGQRAAPRSATRSRTPLFQVFLNVLNAPVELIELDGVVARGARHRPRGGAVRPVRLGGLLDHQDGRLRVQHRPLRPADDRATRRPLPRRARRTWSPTRTAGSGRSTCSPNGTSGLSSSRGRVPSVEVEAGVGAHSLFERQAAAHAGPCGRRVRMRRSSPTGS